MLHIYTFYSIHYLYDTSKGKQVFKTALLPHILITVSCFRYASGELIAGYPAYINEHYKLCRTKKTLDD